MAFYAYIVASRRNGTLYTGSTDDIATRSAQHRDKTFRGFTAKYGVATLVWFEIHASRESAFRRERQIKEWKRVWKLELIEKTNPGWRDLFDDLFAPPPAHPGESRGPVLELGSDGGGNAARREASDESTGPRLSPG